MKSVFRMVAFGEILWDMLPTGKKPGGAPANFAYHANQLGVSTGILSSLGNDALGEEIQEYLTAHQLSMELVSHTSEYPTGTVAVHLDENGQPSYEIIQNVAWDSIPLPESTGPFVSLDAFYFGSLAARSEFNQETLRKLFAVIPQQTIRIFDLNLRVPFYKKDVIVELLEESTVFKLNEEELAILLEMFREEFSSVPVFDGITGEKGLVDATGQAIRTDILDWLWEFMKRFSLTHLILTCGKFGSFILNVREVNPCSCSSCSVSTQRQVSFCPAQPVTVVDTIGAGDSFTAVCACGILKKWPLDVINRRANEYAAFICSQSGAMPPVPAEWIEGWF